VVSTRFQFKASCGLLYSSGFHNITVHVGTFLKLNDFTVSLGS